jgi:hypothetical protein
VSTHLTALLNATTAADTEAAKCALLDDFHRGAPVSDLLQLLQSENAIATESGIWIASELGAIGQQLLPDIVPLLAHPSRLVRFFALDCVLAWATPADAAALAAALRLTQDPDPAVRWKTLRILAAASTAQLQAAHHHLAARHAAALAWLLSQAATTPAQITARLHDPDPLSRQYAAVAAARLAQSQSDRAPLTEAASSPDPEISQFAADTLAAT